MLQKIVLWILLILVLLLVTSTQLFAVEQSPMSQKLAKLHHASKAEKYKLINDIKRDMVTLNSKQRAETIRKLRKMMKQKRKAKPKRQKQEIQHKKYHVQKQKIGNTHPQKAHKKGLHKRKGHQKRFK